MKMDSSLCCLFALSLLGCRGAELVAVSVEELGPMQSPPMILGRDGGVSGLFRGRSVWVYGDSVVAQNGIYPSTWRNNTMSWTEDLTAADGIQDFVQPTDIFGVPREFFPRTNEEWAFNDEHFDYGVDCVEPCGARYAIWGSGPISDLKNDRALLVYGKIYAEPGEFNFHYVGTAIATWSDFDEGPVRPEVESDLEDPTLLFDASEGEFGIPALDGDMLYLFSCSGGVQEDGRCRLARAPLDDVLRRGSWEFWAGSGWSSSAYDAVGLFNGSPNMTVHWSSYLGRWLAIYMDWGSIQARTAVRLEGPWSGSTTLFRPSQSNAIHALAHEEFQEDGGRVEYISYLADTFYLLRVELALPR